VRVQKEEMKMTPQHLLAIDFKEIRGLTVTCKCAASFTLPLPQSNLREHVQCMGCNKTLWGGAEDPRYVRLLGMTRSLTNWQGLEQQEIMVGFSVLEPAEHVKNNVNH
jgi:hypothetical protein